MTKGWKLGDVPRPDEVVQVNIGMYCMERVGIHHDLKDEVRAFLADPSANTYTAADFIGWDPTSTSTSSPLSQATPVPPVSGHVDDNGVSISVFRAVSNALIYTFYADRVGLGLGCSYQDVFKYLPALRPWSGPDDLPKQVVMRWWW